MYTGWLGKYEKPVKGLERKIPKSNLEELGCNCETDDHLEDSDFVLHTGIPLLVNECPGVITEKLREWLNQKLGKETDPTTLRDHLNSWTSLGKFFVWADPYVSDL